MRVILTRVPIVIFLIALFSIKQVAAQSVGVNTNTPDASAVLDITATNKGLLIPRVSLVDVTDTTSPINNLTEGLVVYNTNAAVTGGKGFCFFDGSSWQHINGGNDDLGNHIATQNIELNGNWLSGDGGNKGLFVDAAGNVGIGISSPATILQIEKNDATNGQVLIEPESTTGQNARLTLRGEHNASTASRHAEVRFENYDNNLESQNALIQQQQNDMDDLRAELAALKKILKEAGAKSAE